MEWHKVSKVLSGFAVGISLALSSHAGITPLPDLKKLEELYPVLPPQIKVSIPAQLDSCLKDNANSDHVLSKAAEWQLTCDISILLKRAEGLKVKTPSVRLLIGRLIHGEINRIKNEVLHPISAPYLSELKSSANNGQNIADLAQPLASAPGMKLAEKTATAPLTDPTVALPNPATQLTSSAGPKQVFWTDILKKISIASVSKDLGSKSGLGFAVDVRPKSKIGLLSPLSASDEALFFRETESLVKMGAFWLRPLYVDSKRPDSVLALEGTLEHLQLLGDALRFTEVKNLLKEQQNLVLKNRYNQADLVRKVSAWVDAYDNPALKDWLLEKLLSLRGSDSKSPSENDLFFWLKSFSLTGIPKDKDSKPFIMRKLRDLAIAFPSQVDQEKIQQTVDKLSLSSEFKLPTTKEMNVAELLIRARAQVKFLDTLGALRTMRRVKQLPADQVSQDDLWESLQFHVKVLRLLDERPQIPGVLQTYLASGKFLDNPPSQKNELQKFLARAHEIARMYWNYDTSEKAIGVIEKIVAINQQNKTDYSLGPALVVRARIAEQAKDTEKEKAIAFIDQALSSRIPQDLMIDLLWRKIFLQMDICRLSGNYSAVFPDFEPLKKLVARDSIEKSRWNFWYGQVLQLNKQSNEALTYFEQAYKLEPYSYYSNLAGLELLKAGKRPKEWTLLSPGEKVNYEKRRWKVPNWELYVSDSGKPRDPVYRDFARVFELAKIGDIKSAEYAYVDLDRTVWQRALASRIPWPKRHEFLRAVAYLRLALGDPQGGLRTTDVARQANAQAIDIEDQLNLYPLPYWANISTEASKRGMNPWLVASLIRQESAFNSRARSWANAIGLMQMIPPVAEEEAKILGLPNFDVENLYDPPTAIQVGSNHLSRLLKTFEDSWVCSIAAYNAGSPPVAKWIGYYLNDMPLTYVERIPFLETRNYVRAILRNYINYHRVYGDADIQIESILKMPKGVPGALVTKAPKE